MRCSLLGRNSISIHALILQGVIARHFTPNDYRDRPRQSSELTAQRGEILLQVLNINLPTNSTAYLYVSPNPNGNKVSSSG